MNHLSPYCATSEHQSKAPVLRRSNPAGHAGWPPGAHAPGLPALGLSEGPDGSGRNAQQTALREVQEESGIAALEFPWGDIHIDTGPYSRGKIARYYLARTTQEKVALLPSPATGRPEHSEYRWLSFAQARRLAAPRVAAVIDWAESLVAPSAARNGRRSR